MYNVTDYTIYSFFFYGVADSVKLDGGIVNDPAVKFTSADSVKGGQDYTLTFTVDDAKAVQKLEILVDGRSAGVITDYTADGSNYTANVPAAMLAGSDQVTFTVRVTNVSGVSYSGSLVVTVVDEPSIGAVTPLKGSQTGSDKRPVISAELINAGENPTVEMTVNGEKVNAVCAGGKATPMLPSPSPVPTASPLPSAGSSPWASPGISCTSVSCTATPSIPTAQALWSPL